MSSSRTETLVDVTMPQMGVSVAEGTVVEWRKQVGDWVEADETIVDISTDKIDTEVPAPAAGRVAEILVEVGKTVDVGTVLARIATAAKPGQAHASSRTAAADQRGRGGHRRAPGRRPRRRPRSRARPRPTGAARAARGAAPAATRPSSSASPPSTASTSTRWRAPGAAGACASRTCSRSSRRPAGAPAPATEEPPLHIESPTGRTRAPAAAAAPASSGSPRRPLPHRPLQPAPTSRRQRPALAHAPARSAST